MADMSERKNITAETIEWRTKRHDGDTHAIDDGGTTYYTTAPHMTADEIAAAFRSGYDGACGAITITDLATDAESRHAA